MSLVMARDDLPHRKTRAVSVESPYGPMFGEGKGKREAHRINDDRVERVVDTLTTMLARKQIDARQETAARKVQAAYELAPSSVRCALASADGGADATNRSPSERQLWAGQVLNEVRGLLGQRDTKVVLLVCGQGFSIEDAARFIFGVLERSRLDKRDALEVGRRFRGGLTDLADLWWPERRHSLKVVRPDAAVPKGNPDQKPGESGQTLINKTRIAGAVVHAGGGKHKRGR